MLKENGFEIHLAVENRGNYAIPYIDKIFYMNFPRTPVSLTNINTIRKLKRIVHENFYNIIHCHTPVPGALTRIAAKRSRGKGTKILYTAHGFHFFKGAPLKNWLLYYPIEWFLSAFTLSLIHI